MREKIHKGGGGVKGWLPLKFKRTRMFLSSGTMGNPVDMINFSINGISHTVSVAEYSNHSLASYVREVAGLTGTKVGISKNKTKKAQN